MNHKGFLLSTKTISIDGLEEKLDVGEILSLVQKNLEENSVEINLDRTKYPKTFFIQQHVSYLARNKKETILSTSLRSFNSHGIMI